MTDRVLLTCVHLTDRMHLVSPALDRHGIAYDVIDVPGQQLGEEELLPIIGNYEGMLAGDDVISARVLQRAGRLRAIAKWGIGIDSIDTAAAHRRGIKVVNTPGVVGDEIADYAMGFLHLLLRRQHEIDRVVRDGEWPKLRGRSAAGLTLGIVGLGSSGLELARRAVAAKLRVVGTDPKPPDAARLRAVGVALVGLDDLFSAADVVSLHAPLDASTRHLVDRRRLALMKRGGLLINVARGGLVDSAALVDALREGHLGGAALDVYEQEPLPSDHPLTRLPTVLLSSHNASNTNEAVDRTTRKAVANLVAAMGYSP